MAKAGGDEKFLRFKEGLVLDRDVAAQAANLVSGVEETYDAPSEEHGRRIQNLLRKLTEGAALSGDSWTSSGRCAKTRLHWPAHCTRWSGGTRHWEITRTGRNPIKRAVHQLHEPVHKWHLSR